MDHSNSAATMDNMINRAACLNIFNIPLCLPCNHHYCLNCIRLFTKVKGRIQCQICKTRHIIPDEGVSAFPQVDNRLILEPMQLVCI